LVKKLIINQLIHTFTTYSFCSL